MSAPSHLTAWIQTVTGSPVAEATELAGSTSATVHAIDLIDGRQLVAKRFDRQDFLDERPDRALHEAAVLDLLDGGDVPAPGLVAVDGDGTQAGAPSVLMSFVQGAPALPAGWVAAMAGNLAAIHAVDPGPITWRYERYNGREALVVPSWASDRAIWIEAFDLAAQTPPATTTAFIHRDYHSGNLLWHDGRLAAVLDWLSGCIGFAAADLAHLRVNLAMDHDMDAADAVLSSYQGLAGEAVWHPVWDVIDAVDFLPYYHGEEAVEQWRWDERPAAATQARFDWFLTESVRRAS